MPPFPCAANLPWPGLGIHPGLEKITLFKCGIGPVGINLFSTALNRREPSLKFLNLSKNPFGDVDLDALALALGRIEN